MTGGRAGTGARTYIFNSEADMQQEGYWIIRTYTAGQVGEKTKYYVPAEKARNKKAAQSCVAKQENNEGNVLRRFARLLNSNFSHTDFLVGLDYSEDGLERVKARANKMKAEAKRERPDEDWLWLAADHEAKLFMRRLKRKVGDVRYLITTSDRDKNNKPVRVHHHIVISAVRTDVKSMWTLAKSVWGLGGADAEHIYMEADHWGLAEYLIGQVRRIADAKKYTPSRNLHLDKPHDRVVHSEAELRLPKGAKFLRRGEHKVGEPQYLRYLLAQTE